jgi:hypothetical protein
MTLAVQAAPDLVFLQRDDRSFSKHFCGRFSKEEM